MLVFEPTQMQLNNQVVIVYPGIELKTIVPACDQWNLHAYGRFTFVDAEQLVIVKGILKNYYGTFIRVLYEGLDYDLKPNDLTYIAQNKNNRS